MKQCKICGEEKEESAFYRDKGMPDGRRNDCKKCKDVKVIAARGRNREKWNAYMRKFRKEHPLSVKDKIHKRNRVMKCRYGIQLGDYDKMVSDQNGLCAICGCPTKQNRFLVVDHDHITGKVRELLCDRCNVSIPVLDNPELLTKAKAYLLKHAK